MALNGDGLDILPGENAEVSLVYFDIKRSSTGLYLHVPTLEELRTMRAGQLAMSVVSITLGMYNRVFPVRLWSSCRPVEACSVKKIPDL